VEVGSFNNRPRQNLTAAVRKGSVILNDEKGDKARVTANDLKATNGTIHVIN
jgi:uncharacterized surface protein with fasciclin (FAS1) repeats